VLIALAITGFVAPGFFLSKDSEGTVAGADDSQKVASQFVDALKATKSDPGGSSDTRGKLRCRDFPASEDKDLSHAVNDGHDGVQFQLGQPQPDPTNARNEVFPLTTASGSSYKIVTALESGKACVLHFVDTSGQ